MGNGPSDHLRLLLVVLAALWLMAFAYAFVAYATTAPEDMGFHRGINRVQAFLGWQGVAGIFALAIFAISRNWPSGSNVRMLGTLPLALLGLLLCVILGVVLWASMAS